MVYKCKNKWFIIKSNKYDESLIKKSPIYDKWVDKIINPLNTKFPIDNKPSNIGIIK